MKRLYGSGYRGQQHFLCPDSTSPAPIRTRSHGAACIYEGKDVHDNSSASVVSEACACGVGRFVVTGRALFLVGHMCTCIIFTRIRTCMTEHSLQHLVHCCIVTQVFQERGCVHRYIPFGSHWH